MPHQLIYTSAPRGLVAGRSGHCTVARSASLREALILQLEKFCYYQHLSLSGGQDRPIFASRIVDLRGARFHVLSRIQDAGLDFTGRTNFVAHHLVFAPEELHQSPTPPVILRDWPGWATSWTKEPQLLEHEDWSTLTALAGKTSLPAQTWQRVTGVAVNAFGLLETRPGASFLVDDQPDETVLQLFAESMELLEVRDPRRDFRIAAWQYTFTTSMQEQDNPADFRWRCIHSDNPAASRFTPPDCRPLSSIRSTKYTAEETALAGTGRQSPRFVTDPRDASIKEGEIAQFQARAEGIPNPAYQWFSLDRAGNTKALPGETGPELLVSNAPLGVSRYLVRATNSAGEATSIVATLSVEQKLRVTQPLAGADIASRDPASAGASYLRSEEEIERQRKRLQAERAEELFQKQQLRNRALFGILIVALIVAVGAFAWKKRTSRKSEKPTVVSKEETNPDTNKSMPQTLTDAATELGSDARSNAPHAPSQATGNKPASIQLKAEPEPTVNSLRRDNPRLPNGWTSEAIGALGYRDTSFVPNRFHLQTAAEGFFTNADNVLFVFKTNSSSEFRASLIAPTNDLSSLGNSGRGIMVRESCNPNSPFLFIGASSQKIVFAYRDSLAQFHREEFAMPANSQDPLIVRIQQEDNQATAAYCVNRSSDAWSSLPPVPIASTQPLLIGFALYSGSSSNALAAQFVDLTVKNEPAWNR
jgi:GTPase-associated protein 1, N-terminal domain type 2